MLLLGWKSTMLRKSWLNHIPETSTLYSLKLLKIEDNWHRFDIGASEFRHLINVIWCWVTQNQQGLFSLPQHFALCVSPQEICSLDATSTKSNKLCHKHVVTINVSGKERFLFHQNFQNTAVKFRIVLKVRNTKLLLYKWIYSLLWKTNKSLL